MDLHAHTHPDKLEYYSFIWSEVRLVIAAVALLVGGTPPIYFLPLFFLYGLVSTLLTLCWIISGAASAYLAYRWYTGGQTLFGGKDMKDTVAFAVMVLSGLNLGITGISGTNIGMSIAYSYPVFIVTGIVYLVAAWYLHKRWKASGEKLFVSAPAI